MRLTMNKKQKTILIIFAFVCVSLTALFCANDFAFSENLEIEYPIVPKAETPGTDPDEPTSLPEYIKYLFNFGIAIGGILAFLVLVYGGFLWMTSAGDPTAIGKAKTKMFGGIIGLCLLLGAYLIIGMIDPDLRYLKEIPDMLAKTGVYLCETDTDCKVKDPDKRKRYSGNIPKFPEDPFNAERACFISKKNELMYLYVHEEEGYKGKIVEEIENTKDKEEEECCSEYCGDISGGKSLSFLWNRPGIYLYQEPNFKVVGTDKTPKYLRNGARNLNEWDNITQSMKIIHPNIETIILGFLFSEPDYSGQCELLNHALYDNDDDLLITEINNLDDCPLVKKTLSSIYDFTIDFSRPGIEGEVKFYDRQNCKGNSFTIPVLSGVGGGYSAIFDGGNFSEHQFEPSGESAEGKVMSFRINGPFIVMITTNEDLTDKNLECKAFLKPNASNCYDSIITSNVYSETDDKLKPRAYYIVPTN